MLLPPRHGVLGPPGPCPDPPVNGQIPPTHPPWTRSPGAPTSSSQLRVGPHIPGDLGPLGVWLGDILDLVVQEGERRVRTRRSLPEGFSWGPFQGSIHSEPASPGHSETVRIWLPISRLAPCVQTPGTG
uniref:Zinc finger protein ZFPM1/2 PR domain-containing protein n=1 Tax=Calidris pygmaea TaxID=425635 RepID=A0A8C3JFJ5_9CHAR